MREIKFRVWCKQFYDMGELTDWSLDGSQLCGVLLDGTQVYLPSEDLVLMQYTGLKDKSGTEIYEGDIVNADAQKATTDSPPLRVVWDGPQWTLWDDNGWQCDLADAKSLEVVGNIYENKVLETP